MSKERLSERWTRRARNGGVLVAAGGLFAGSSGLAVGGAAGAILFEALHGNARVRRLKKEEK